MWGTKVKDKNGKFYFKCRRKNIKEQINEYLIFFFQDISKKLLWLLLLGYNSLCSQRGFSVLSFSSSYILFQKKLKEWLSNQKIVGWK